jgi:hypothetical protein
MHASPHQTTLALCAGTVLLPVTPLDPESPATDLSGNDVEDAIPDAGAEVSGFDAEDQTAEAPTTGTVSSGT